MGSDLGYNFFTSDPGGLWQNDAAKGQAGTNHKDGWGQKNSVEGVVSTENIV